MFVVVAVATDGSVTVYGRTDGQPWGADEQANASAAASDPEQWGEPGTTAKVYAVVGLPE